MFFYMADINLHTIKITVQNKFTYSDSLAYKMTLKQTLIMYTT